MTQAGVAAAHGTLATGLDFSEAQAGLTRARYLLQLSRGDGMARAFESGQFDSIVMRLGMPRKKRRQRR